MYIPAQGSGAPVHTAPRGALYYRSSNHTFYIQTATPTGSTWVLVPNSGVVGLFKGLEFTRVTANPGGTASNTLWQDDGTNFAAGTLVWENFLRLSSYVDFVNIVEPAAPAAGTSRLYGFTIQSHDRMAYNDRDGTQFVVCRDNADICKNVSGGALAKGAAVYVSGAVGASGTPEVSLAKADSVTTCTGVLIAMEAVSSNAFGAFMRQGYVRGVDTSAWAVGTLLYTSPSTGGGLTSTKPTTPGQVVQYVGVVLAQHAVNGAIAVDIESPVEIPAAAGVVDSLVFEARLSPSSTLAVPTADVASVTTLYLQPYKGNRVALYDTVASSWSIFYISAAVSKALSGLTASRPYDVFLYDNSGTLTLEFVAWTSSTARATALTTQDGVIVKSGDASRRYVGTFYATGTTTTAWVTDGGVSTSAKLLIWNYYNRLPVYPHVREDTNSWVYTSAIWRSLNNATDNRIEVVVGVQEDMHRIVTRASALTSTTAQAIGVGIGLDSTSADSSNLRSEATMNTSGRMMLTAEKLIQGTIGYHYYQALEYARAGTPTLEGDLGVVTVMSGIMGEFRA